MASISLLKFFSKFNNVFLKPCKKEEWEFPNNYLSSNCSYTSLCIVNPKFLAVMTGKTGPGGFIVLPLAQEDKRIKDPPKVSGHRDNVRCIAWCPHDDNVIASGGEDRSVKVWRIPDHGLAHDTSLEPLVTLNYHAGKVILVLWHPTAKDVLLTAGSDNKIVIWNVNTGEPTVVIDSHPDLVYSACWNWGGSKLLTTCKDKKIRIIDPRNGNVEEEAICHEGLRFTYAIYLRDGLVFTTGFSKTINRQYSLREPGRLNDPIIMELLDEPTGGVMFPLYDADTNMVYFFCKGEFLIPCYLITSEHPFVRRITTFNINVFKNGPDFKNDTHPIKPEEHLTIAMMPKRGVDVTTHEITRFYRITYSNKCEVISVIVPRTSKGFQEDLYPNTPGLDPALSAKDWFTGKDGMPILVSMRPDRRLSAVKNKKLKASKSENKIKKTLLKALVLMKKREVQSLSSPMETDDDDQPIDDQDTDSDDVASIVLIDTSEVGSDHDDADQAVEVDEPPFLSSPSLQQPVNAEFHTASGSVQLGNSSGNNDPCSSNVHQSQATTKNQMPRSKRMRVEYAESVPSPVLPSTYDFGSQQELEVSYVGALLRSQTTLERIAAYRTFRTKMDTLLNTLSPDDEY